MEMTLKSSDIAMNLGVTVQTVRRWVLRYPQFFSEDAVAPNRPQSLYNLEDFRILKTIHELAAVGHGVEVIAQKLAEGYRYAGSLDITPLDPQIRSTRNKDKDFAPLQKRLTEMAVKIELLEKSAAQDQDRIEALMNELTTTKHQLGVAEGELKAMKEFLRSNGVGLGQS